MRLVFTEVREQNGSFAPPPPPAFQMTDNFPSSFRPSIAVIIAVLVTMFSLTFLLLLYARHCKQNAMAREDAASNHAAARPRTSGLDRALVESLPFFKFSSLKGIKEGLDCSVCLNAFQESEMLRLLPKCKHAFHVECVDMWLESHSTCPLCRHKVDPDDVLLPEDTKPTDFQFQEEAAAPVEFFVQREIEADGERSFRSSRFNIDRIGSSRQEGKNCTFLQESVGIGCLSGRKEGRLLAEAEIVDYERFVQRFAHRIIVSDVIFQHRWSDFKSSDLDFLDSHILRTGSRRFSLAYGSTLPESKPYTSHAASGSALAFESGTGKILKIKDEMERKRKLDMQASRLKKSCLLQEELSTQNNIRGRLPIPLNSPGRSMSEITSFDRFARSRTGDVPKETQDKIKRWFAIARPTLQWFEGRERGAGAATTAAATTSGGIAL